MFEVFSSNIQVLYEKEEGRGRLSTQVTETLSQRTKQNKNTKAKTGSKEYYTPQGPVVSNTEEADEVTPGLDN